MSYSMREYLQHASALAERGTVFVTVTLVEPEGHVPQDLHGELSAAVGLRLAQSPMGKR